MSRHIYHWSKVKMTERAVANNTRDTQKASKIEDILVNTKNCMKNIGVLKKILLRYSYTPITQLELKEMYIDHYSAKFTHDMNNSWLYSMVNNICMNVWTEYITNIDMKWIRGWLHNMGVQMRKWWNANFSWAVLCWRYMEHFPKKWVGNSRLKCFTIDAVKQPEELVRVLNRGYVLCECRIASNEMDSEMLKNCEISASFSQLSWNINKVYSVQKNGYDSTFFTNIYYDKNLKVIKEIWGWGNVSMWNNITYPLKDWIQLINSWAIRSELCFVSQSIE